MLIGNVEIKNPLVSAPMAGVTNSAYRVLAREAGAGLVCTEMISAKGLVYNYTRTRPYLAFNPREKPISFQIFGAEPDFMAQAAVHIAELGADIIDINMGCPVTKVVKKGEGCALMQNLPRAGEVISAVVEAVSVPVTVKIRKGWDADQVNAVEAALLAEEVGAAAVTVHGRTREEFYSGVADWQVIRRVAEAVKIPVLGSGDIFEVRDVARMLEETGCAGVMVGRGALGNPWFFTRARHYLQEGILLPPPGWQERIKGTLTHMDLLVKLKGEKVGIREMRKHASWYIKGLEGASTLRKELCGAKTCQDMRDILLNYARQLEAQPEITKFPLL